MIKETVNLAKSLLLEGCGLILRPTPEKKNIRGFCRRSLLCVPSHHENAQGGSVSLTDIRNVLDEVQIKLRREHSFPWMK